MNPESPDTCSPAIGLQKLPVHRIFTFLKMPLTQAERSKNYRRRRKESEGKGWLKMEATRKKTKYIPAQELDEKALKVQRMRKRLASLKYRENMKTQENVIQSPLKIKFPFQVPVKSTQKARERKRKLLLQEKNKKIKELKSQVQKMKTQVKSTRKRANRWKNKVHLQKSRRSRKVKTTNGAATPKSTSASKLRKFGISPRSQPALHRHLTAYQVLLREVWDAKDEAKKDNIRLHHIVAGRVTKRYRMLRSFGRELRLSRYG